MVKRMRTSSRRRWRRNPLDPLSLVTPHIVRVACRPSFPSPLATHSLECHVWFSDHPLDHHHCADIQNTELQDHQITGMNWLISLYHKGINGILADQMVGAFLSESRVTCSTDSLLCCWACCCVSSFFHFCQCGENHSLNSCFNVHRVSEKRFRRSRCWVT